MNDKNDNTTHTKKDHNADIYERVAKTGKKPDGVIPLLAATDVDRFRALIVAWNHICDSKTVYDTDKDAICQTVCSIGEEKGWLEWDDTVMEYYFIPDGCHLSEVR